MVSGMYSPSLKMAFMPVAMASGVTEMAWPNDIEATVLSLSRAGTSGRADSFNSLGAAA